MTMIRPSGHGVTSISLPLHKGTFNFLQSQLLLDGMASASFLFYYYTTNNIDFVPLGKAIQAGFRKSQLEIENNSVIKKYKTIDIFTLFAI